MPNLERLRTIHKALTEKARQLTKPNMLTIPKAESLTPEQITTLREEATTFLHTPEGQKALREIYSFNMLSHDGTMLGFELPINSHEPDPQLYYPSDLATKPEKFTISRYRPAFLVVEEDLLVTTRNSHEHRETITNSVAKTIPDFKTRLLNNKLHVIAGEISHIKNRDLKFFSMPGYMFNPTREHNILAGNLLAQRGYLLFCYSYDNNWWRQDPKYAEWALADSMPSEQGWKFIESSPGIKKPEQRFHFQIYKSQPASTNGS